MSNIDIKRCIYEIFHDAFKKYFMIRFRTILRREQNALYAFQSILYVNCAAFRAKNVCGEKWEWKPQKAHCRTRTSDPLSCNQTLYHWAKRALCILYCHQLWSSFYLSKHRFFSTILWQTTVLSSYIIIIIHKSCSTIAISKNQDFARHYYKIETGSQLMAA